VNGDVMAERPTTGPVTGPQRVVGRAAAPPVGSLWPAAAGATNAAGDPAGTPPSGTPASSHGPADVDPGPGPAEPGRMVRPYALTGGRTRSKGTELAIETMVTATAAGRSAGAGLAWERRAIVELCTSPQSIAEVSAHLGIPLGVARVLVGDLASEGLLAVHGADVAAASDVSLLERVLHGLRAL